MAKPPDPTKMAIRSKSNRIEATIRPGRSQLSGLIVWLALCACAILAPPLHAQSELSPEESYTRIVGELYPDETGPFSSFYSGLDAYDRAALARVIERLDAGEWGLFAQLLTGTDRPTAIKILRLLAGYNDDQLGSVTQALKKRGFHQWEAIPALVRAETLANTREMLLGYDAQNPCIPAEYVEPIEPGVEPDAPAMRNCSDAEEQFRQIFFAASTGYVSRGVLAEAGEIPWQVQFSLHGASTRAYRARAERDKQIERFGRELADWEINHTCGAVYLGARFVLTAAHCIGNLNDSRFFAGRRIHLGSININGERNLYKIKNVLVHADYKNDTLQNDIALIQLKKVPTGFRRNLRSVDIASAPAKPSGRVPLLLSGWGYNRPATSSSNIFALDGQRQAPAQPSLLKGDVWVQKLSVCKNNRHFRRRQIQLYPGQICVGSPAGIDSCRGDSGGPLVDARSEVLVGLVSGSAGCGLRGTPSIFTDVGYYRSWIDRAKTAAPRLRAGRKHQFR
jgi:secreted trypsin-like serine protease